MEASPTTSSSSQSNNRTDRRERAGEEVGAPSSGIAVVTDSTSDLPESVASRYGINVIPNILIIEGKSMLDGKDITRQDFYNSLPGMRSFPTTATTSSGEYQKKYDELFHQGFRKIVSIHASSLLSGIINAASSAAQAYGDRVCVVDSRQVSLGLGFQVLAAAKAVQEGADLPAILRKLDELRSRIRLVAMLDTLEYIRRSGRVSWARARLGDFLHIKPFVEIRDGKVMSLGETRTTSRGIARMKALLQSIGALESLAILHTNAEDLAHRFLGDLSVQIQNDPLIVNVTTVIGAHVGPNGLGFTAVASTAEAFS